MPFPRTGAPQVHILKTASSRAELFGLLFISSVAIGTIHYVIICNRHRDALSRRATQAVEMSVLKARLERFDTKIAGGGVMDGKEMQEKEMMEKLFRRWSVFGG